MAKNSKLKKKKIIKKKVNVDGEEILNNEKMTDEQIEEVVEKVKELSDVKEEIKDDDKKDDLDLEDLEQDDEIEEKAEDIKKEVNEVMADAIVDLAKDKGINLTDEQKEKIVKQGLNKLENAINERVKIVEKNNLGKIKVKEDGSYTTEFKKFFAFMLIVPCLFLGVSMGLLTYFTGAQPIHIAISVLGTIIPYISAYLYLINKFVQDNVIDNNEKKLLINKLKESVIQSFSLMLTIQNTVPLTKSESSEEKEEINELKIPKETEE